MKKILVIAGSWKEFQNFLYDIRDGRENFLYAGQTESAWRSCEASHVITIGTGQFRGDYEELQKMTTTRIK